jgi:hypothetical protein
LLVNKTRGKCACSQYSAVLASVAYDAYPVLSDNFQ